MKDLYTGNYETLKKDQDLNKWNETPCLWIGRHDFDVYWFNAIPIKILAGFFCIYQQADSKISMERQNSKKQPNKKKL